jgi:hypothetical protein
VGQAVRSVETVKTAGFLGYWREIQENILVDLEAGGAFPEKHQSMLLLLFSLCYVLPWLWAFGLRFLGLRLAGVLFQVQAKGKKILSWDVKRAHAFVIYIRVHFFKR